MTNYWVHLDSLQKGPLLALPNSFLGEQILSEKCLALLSSNINIKFFNSIQFLCILISLTIMNLNLEQVLIHNPFDSFSLFFFSVFSSTLQFGSSVFKLQLSWKHTKENLPALARYYYAAKVKNNKRSFIVCLTPSLGLNMSDCLRALAVNARKAGLFTLQFLEKLHHIWAYLAMNVYQKLLFKLSEGKSLQKKEAKIRTPTRLFLHLEMTQH